MTAIHETTERWIRDLPVLDADTWLVVHRVRGDCLVCGPRVEHLPWRDHYARATRRLAVSVARLCALLPIKPVAELYDLHWQRVKRIDKARKVIKSSRWLLRNPDNIRKHEDRLKLSEVLSANRKLMTVYVLKNDLNTLWEYRHVGYAWRFWLQQYRRAIRSRIEPRRPSPGD